jgi:Cytochrome P460
MRTRIVGLVAVVALAASAAVVAVASTSANGLPSYTDGYAKWPKVNRKPIVRCGPPCAHGGVKNVYASKRKVGSKYPNGTVVVKSIVESGTKYVAKVAVMRKVRGRWRYVEYTRTGPRARYTVLAQGQLCQSCHAQARSNDYVFTKR